MKRLTISMLAICLIGCSGKEEDPGKATSETNKSDSGESSTSVVSPKGTDAESPAFQLQANVPADATPEDVVVAAIKAWQSGDEPGFKALLTPDAQIQTDNLGFVMENLPPTMKFEIKSTAYVTEKQEAAHVSFAWSESSADGDAIVEEGFWLLRRIPTVGWRVSGMANLIDPVTKEVDTFNFEDAEELAKKLGIEYNANSRPRNAKGGPTGAFNR